MFSYVTLLDELFFLCFLLVFGSSFVLVAGYFAELLFDGGEVGEGSCGPFFCDVVEAFLLCDGFDDVFGLFFAGDEEDSFSFGDEFFDLLSYGDKLLGGLVEVDDVPAFSFHEDVLLFEDGVAGFF